MRYRVTSWAYDLGAGRASQQASTDRIQTAIVWARRHQDNRFSVVHDVVRTDPAAPSMENEWIGLTTYELTLLLAGDLHIPPRTRWASRRTIKL